MTMTMIMMMMKRALSLQYGKMHFKIMLTQGESMAFLIFVFFYVHDDDDDDYDDEQGILHCNMLKCSVLDCKHKKIMAFFNFCSFSR